MYIWTVWVKIIVNCVVVSEKLFLPSPSHICTAFIELTINSDQRSIFRDKICNRLKEINKRKLQNQIKG